MTALPGRGEYETIVAHALAAETTTGTADLPRFTDPVLALVVQRNITAATGTSPTVALSIEGSLDDGANWYQVSTTGSASGTIGTSASVISLFGSNSLCQRMRLKWTIAGTTPSVTFSAYVQVVKGS